ncbi:DUF397 domain-containing protein [Streptomyces sp. Qhu-G9]|uniref:DUF397 domain-containing protein n=1 Tax=Streptomyces sp. Qhu-G9 TaxID=3452799 RepID=UPI0022AC82B4|nr:DUF397 domain-containing protein [Streptomyces aurantiacus]WAU79446.1 DUF397 domain-containing protein [Streptomyces aurantiacus]
MASESGRKPDTAWFKSSYSGGNETECVECTDIGDHLYVRDSKCADSPVVTVRASAWRAFIRALEGHALVAR